MSFYVESYRCECDSSRINNRGGPSRFAIRDVKHVKSVNGGALLLTTAVALLLGGRAAWADDPTAKLDAKTLAPPSIISPSQAGDPASDPKLAVLSDTQCAAAKARAFKVGVIMQTMNIQWSTEQVRGITDGLTRCGAKIIGVTNPDFTVEKQIGQIADMIQLKPDAVISIPVDDVATAGSYKSIQQAGIKLVLMDNVPKGLQHGTDYQTIVSSDSEGLGAESAGSWPNTCPKRARSASSTSA